MFEKINLVRVNEWLAQQVSKIESEIERLNEQLMETDRMHDAERSMFIAEQILAYNNQIRTLAA